MYYPLSLPGFEETKIGVDTGDFTSGPRILVNGLPAPKGPKRGEFLLKRSDGSETVAQIKSSNFLDPVPQVVVDNKTYKLSEPLKWYQWLWAGLPIGLLFVGGAIGAIVGSLAVAANTRVFRSNVKGVLKFILTGSISFAALILYLVLAVLFTRLINGPAV